MDFDQKIVVSPDTVFQELEGECVLLNLGTSKYFGLDEIGTRAWQLIQEHRLARLVYEGMLREFDVEPERLETDLERLLGDLHEKGLVDLRPN